MNILASLLELINPPPTDPGLARALERVANYVDPLLPAMPGFEKQLAKPVHHALDYCQWLVSTLPGPVELGRQAFSADPLVHALFATANDIDEMLGRSQEVRDFLREPCSWDSDHFHALFAAQHEQKHQLGMARDGEVIRSDVPQTVVYFSHPQLVVPACQLEMTLSQLRCKAFERLLDDFHAGIEVLRAERAQLRSEIALERSGLSMLVGAGKDSAFAEGEKSVADLDRRLLALNERLHPESQLQALAEHLQNAEQHLKLNTVELRLDAMGVVQGNGSSDGQVFRFMELKGRDGNLHLLMLARIARAEAREAVERVREEQQHRPLI